MLHLTHMIHSFPPIPSLPPSVPLAGLLELNPTPPKNVQCTSNRQVHFPATQPFDQLQVFQTPSTSGVRYGDGADGGQVRDESLVDTGLLAFDICGVDEEFCAVRFEECDVFYAKLARQAC